MTSRVAAEAFAPGEYLKDELDERGWTQDEFATMIGRSPAVVNQIISGKRGVSPETASEIGAALGTSAIYWMNLDSAYRLWHIERKASKLSLISQEARIRERFPVREMVKRGWIDPSANAEVLEAQIKSFFGIGDLDETPRLAHAAKKTGYPQDITGTQRAWLFRVKQVAEAMTVRPYSERALREAIPELNALRTAAEDIRRVPHILAECGVRFVIVEHVPASKIDGVCLWLGEKTTTPVIGMSLRLDRIDNFWFVLRHEIEHVLNKHGREEAIVDSDVQDTSTTDQARELPEEEKIANHAAADFCVPEADMADFVLRHRPLFSEEKVLNFASRMQVHPGLVVGQLQRRANNYRLFRKYLVSIRSIIAPVATTDGFGQIVALTA